jgi:hypothetical protein
MQAQSDADTRRYPAISKRTVEYPSSMRRFIFELTIDEMLNRKTLLGRSTTM